ncbi:MAG: tetratricopeptide repeat protein [Acidobacteria bacterium]|nr:tetratricopeptide repeat protein [Acidobacteriota bacterium]
MTRPPWERGRPARLGAAGGRSDGLRPQLRTGRLRSQGGLRHFKKCPISIAARRAAPAFKIVATEDGVRQSLVIVLLLLFSLAPVADAQTQFEFTPDIDHLLRDALNKMYRYELKAADEAFDDLVRRFPEHPIGYMHKAEVVWWHALRDNKNRPLEAAFERYTERAISKGQSLLKRNPKDFYTLLYVAGAYGNRTRYNVYISKSYYRAMRAGIKGYDFVGPAHALRKDYVDCLIGIGAYNYFAGSLPAVIKLFSWMFTEGGDKRKGIQQLELAAQKGEYGQVAAKMVLLGVYYNEKRLADYQRLISALIEQFPTNPVFVTWLADFYLRQGKLDEGNQQLTFLLSGAKNGSRSKLSLAQTYFEKGRLELEKRSPDDSIASFTRVIEGDLNSGDPLLAKARLLRGCAWDLKGRREQAVADYQAVLRLQDADDSHRKARGFLKQAYKGKTRP